MKKIIFTISILIITFLIYLIANQKSNLEFSIGLEYGDIIYNPNDYRITDIIIDIENNINIEGKDIQHLLVSSKSIKIDLNKFIFLKDYESILGQINDLEKLFQYLRKYTKENVYIKLLKEKNILAEYTNKKIIVLSKKYDIIVMR